MKRKREESEAFLAPPHSADGEVTRRKILLGSNNTAQLGIAGVRLPQSAEVQQGTALERRISLEGAMLTVSSWHPHVGGEEEGVVHNEPAAQRHRCH